MRKSNTCPPVFLFLLLLFLAGSTVFGQMVYLGLTPGQCDRQQVNAALGAPLRPLSSISFEHPPQQGTGRIEVEYDGTLASRIHVYFALPVPRAALVERVLGKQAPETRRTFSDGTVYEFFGAPFFVALTYPSGATGAQSICYFSRARYDQMLGKSSPSVIAPTPPPGYSPSPLAPGGEIRVRLLTPVSARLARKGERAAAEVISPAALAGAVFEGGVAGSVTSAGNSGPSTLSLIFALLRQGDQILPISVELVEVANSRGLRGVDESNNRLKFASHAGASIAIGGEGPAANPTIFEFASNGPDLSFAPGSEFVLRIAGAYRPVSSPAPSPPTGVGVTRPGIEGTATGTPPATTPTASTPPTTGTIRNLALNQATRESSIYNDLPTDSPRGVNGQKSDFFSTKLERNPWWQVDLGANYPLTEIRVFNRTDCCAERARTLRVLLSPDGASWQTVYVHNGSPIGGENSPLVVSVEGRQARYVRLQLAEENHLNISEVEVYGYDRPGAAAPVPGPPPLVSGGTTAPVATLTRNLALGRSARESSIYNDRPADPSLGVDGNQDNFFGTKSESNPWWEVDLGADHVLTEIRVYNRKDCCRERARTLRVLLTPAAGPWQTAYIHNGAVFGDDGKPLVVPLNNKTARFIRLQLAEENYLNIAEVEVYGQ